MATNGTTRRLLQHAPAVRVFIGLGAAIGVVTALLVIAQAGLLSSTVARAFLGGTGLAELAVPLVALLGVVLATAALGWGGEVAAQRAAAGAVAQLRAAVHFLDVVAGLDVLTAYGRARRQRRQIAAMSERYRAETMRGLRVAFLFRGCACPPGTTRPVGDAPLT